MQIGATLLAEWRGGVARGRTGGRMGAGGVTYVMTRSTLPGGGHDPRGRVLGARGMTCDVSGAALRVNGQFERSQG